MFVEAAMQNPNSVSIMGTMLFYSDRIFKDKSAKKKMKPIVKKLTQMYGDMDMLQTMQTDMAQSAYRDVVAAAGPEATKLPEGWKILGLDKEQATAIFEEQQEIGFLDAREMLDRDEVLDAQRKEQLEKDALQRLKDSFDKDGNIIDPDAEIDEDKKLDFDEIKKNQMKGGSDDGENGEDKGVGRAKECQKCGYVLFIAPGRESKFFSPSFQCPQCGAPKRQFASIDVEGQSESGVNQSLMRMKAYVMQRVEVSEHLRLDY